MVNRITVISKRISLWLSVAILGAILPACSQSVPAPIVNIIPQHSSNPSIVTSTPYVAPVPPTIAATPQPSYSLPARVQPIPTAAAISQSAPAKKPQKNVANKAPATPQKITPAKPATSSHKANPAPPPVSPSLPPTPPPPPAAPAVSTLPVPVTAATPAVPAARMVDGLSWQWPMALPVKYTVASDQGIDIAGTLNQPIYAASAGSVVYLGPGIFGYGQMLMIQHNNLYLTVYANIDKSLVQQSDTVQSGQKIALLGKSPQGVVVLHFEIRKEGDPVDPTTYLPVVTGN